MWRWFVVGLACMWALSVLSACGGGDGTLGGGTLNQPATKAPTHHEVAIATRDFVFSFQLDEPGQLTAYTSGEANTHGTLSDTTLAPPRALSQDQASGDGGNFRIVTALASGTYELAIVASGDVTTPYTLTVIFAASPVQ